MGLISNVPVVYADDFTGAAALGGALRGLAVGSLVVNEVEPDTLRKVRDSGEVFIINVATRDVSPEQTKGVLAPILAQTNSGLAESLMFRVDSTMRGNIATTAEIARDVLRARFGSDCLVFVSIANPDAGRTVESGQLHVWGELASDTELSQDPTWHVTTSTVGEFLFESQRSASKQELQTPRENWALIESDVLERGVEHTLRHVHALQASEVQTFVADGRNASHAEVLSAVIRRIELSHPVCVLDSGPLIQALVSSASCHENSTSRVWPGATKPVVVISGSSTERTRSQLRFLTDNFGGLSLSLLAGNTRLRANLSIVGTLASSLTSMTGHDVITLDSSLNRPERDFGPRDVARALEVALGEVAKACVNNPPAGLVLVGGETCLHFLAAIGAEGIRPGGILEPLMPFGTIVGGPLDGMPTVTKGGLVGTDSSLVSAVMHLRDKGQTDMSAGVIGELQKEGK